MKVDYLGHVISFEGGAVDPSKIRSILEWQIPIMVKDLREREGGDVTMMVVVILRWQ